MVIAGLWRYGDWRHVATGCNAVVAIVYRTLIMDNNPVSSEAWHLFIDDNSQWVYLP